MRHRQSNLDIPALNGQRMRRRDLYPIPSFSVSSVLSVVGIFLLLTIALPDLVKADDLYRSARLLLSRQAAAIERLAESCDEQGLDEQAQATRRLLGPPRDPYKLYVPVLAREIGRKKAPGDASKPVAKWHERIARLKHDQSDALFDMARRAARTQRASLAFELVLATLRVDPDHDGARRLLGYPKFRNRWQTAFEARMLRQGMVWHDEFGWLPKAHVKRYEEGQRFDRGRWITSEEDARRHQDIEAGWLVETEHYAVRTNHSLEAGVTLGVKLEKLFTLWKQLFVRYYASESQLQAMFDGRSRGRGARMPRFRVVFFRDREDYNRSLRAVMSNIEISIGVYYQSTQRAYFFAGEGYEDRTLYHEATHQLFHQSRPVALSVGERANFWIVEGIALYMESLREEDGYHVLGGLDDQRIHAARYRLLHDDFYVPLDELTGYGMEKLQTDERIATLYSQAAGLTHFLVHYEDGRYRDALVAYLTAVYEAADNRQTLVRLTETPYAQLDQKYREYMESSKQ